MNGYFKHEWHEFITSHKNIGIYLLVLFISFFYWFQIENNFEYLEKIVPEKIEASYTTKDKFLKTVNREGATHPDTQSAIDAFPPIVESEAQQLALLEEKNYSEFAKVRSDWYMISVDKWNPLYYKDGNPDAAQEAYYATSAMHYKLSDYAKLDSSVTLNEINEKTAIQSFRRLMDYLLPLIMVLVAAFFSMDIVTKDRKHKSVTKNFPISGATQLLTKMSIVLIGTFLSLIPLLIGFIGMGIFGEFGRLDLPTVISSFQGDLAVLGDVIFKTVPMWQMMLQFLLLLFLLVLLISLISLFLGIWINNSYFILLILLCLPFTELLYNRAGYGDIHSITYLPSSYIRLGEIVSGHRGFFFSDTQLSYESGLLVLSVSCLVMLILVGISSRMKKSIV